MDEEILIDEDYVMESEEWTYEPADASINFDKPESTIEAFKAAGIEMED